jgi:HSP20 family molecular chaperone IbpA
MNRYVPLFGLVMGAWFTLSVNGEPYPSPGGGGYYPRPPQASVSAFHTHRSLRFQRYQDENGYHLRILTEGYAPDAIQVKIAGPYLLVENQESNKVENRYEHGYSFSTNSSSMRRRFRLPPNADGAAMARSEEEGVIVVTLPYR